jgi:outer membrane biosynthesis protein TonB
MRIALLAFLLTASSFAAAENRGFCPSPSGGIHTGKAQPREAPSPDMQHAGDVMILAVISDTGYVCSARLLAGFDHDADQQAVSTAKSLHFHPARMNGQRVPVQVIVQLTFWRGTDGKLVMEQLKPEKQADSPASRSVAPTIDSIGR